MSMLLDFVGGAVDAYRGQRADEQKRKQDYIDRKRELAERMNLLITERKWRQEDAAAQRKLELEDRNSQVDETYQENGNLVQRLKDGTTKIVRKLTEDEIRDKDLRRRTSEANLRLIERNANAPYSTGRDTDDSERTYEVDKDEALAMLGLISEDELDDAPQEVRDMYLNLKGRRLTDAQKNELRSRFNATRRRDSAARKGAIIFDTGGGENLEDMKTGSLLNRVAN